MKKVLFAFALIICVTVAQYCPTNYVFDEADEDSVSFRNGWAVSKAGKNYKGKQYAVSSSATSVARFSPIVARATYTVSLYWPLHTGCSTATTVRVVLKAGGGVTSVLDQCKNAGKYNALGNFNFGPGDYVEITPGASGVAVVDSLALDRLSGPVLPAYALPRPARVRAQSTHAGDGEARSTVSQLFDCSGLYVAPGGDFAVAPGAAAQGWRSQNSAPQSVELSYDDTINVDYIVWYNFNNPEGDLRQLGARVVEVWARTESSSQLVRVGNFTAPQAVRSWEVYYGHVVVLNGTNLPLPDQFDQATRSYVKWDLSAVRDVTFKVLSNFYDGQNGICGSNPGAAGVDEIILLGSIDAKCGDGKLGVGEQCDDGNKKNGDGCSSRCTIEQGHSCRHNEKHVEGKTTYDDEKRKSERKALEDDAKKATKDRKRTGQVTTCKGKKVDLKDGKVSLCHSTASASNPYVLITIDESGLNGHLTHASNRPDIFPESIGSDGKYYDCNCDAEDAPEADPADRVASNCTKGLTPPTKKSPCNATFDGTTAPAVVRANFPFPLTQVSVELWVSTNDTSRDAAMVSYATPSVKDQFALSKPSSIEIWLFGNRTSTFVSVADGKFHHVAVTWASETGVLNLVVDGFTKFTSVVSKGSSFTTGGTLVLGQRQSFMGGGFQQSQSFLGALDDVKIFRYTRPDTKIGYEAGGACSCGCPWRYQVDSFYDGVDYYLVGPSSPYEMFAIAMKITEDEIQFAINGNMPLLGHDDKHAQDGNIGFGDLLLNWDYPSDAARNLDTVSKRGELWAIHFSYTNDAGDDSTATPLPVGIYRNVTAKTVALKNAGFTTINNMYFDYTKNLAGIDYTNVFGNLDRTYFASTPYNSIAKGTYVAGLRMLNATTELSDLNFAANAVWKGLPATGKYTFGFAVPRDFLPEGAVAMTIAYECHNDGMGWLTSTDTDSCEKPAKPLDPPLPELVARYTFDDCSDCVAKDISKSKAHAKIYPKCNDDKKPDVPAPEPSKCALSCDGSLQRYAITNPVEGFPATDVTVEFWLKASNTTKRGTPFSWAYKGVDMANGLLIYDYNAFQFFVDGKSVPTSIKGNDGKWGHYAFSWSSATGSVRAYKNGELVFSKDNFQKGVRLGQDGSLALCQDQDFVGGGFDATQSLDGQIDGLRVWSSVRTAEQIAASRASPDKALAASETSLFLEYLWNECSATKCKDTRAGARDCVIFPDGEPEPPGSPSGCNLAIPSKGITTYARRAAFDTFPNTALTVELWVKVTDKSTQGTPFSYATSVHDNSVLLYNTNALEIHLNGNKLETKVAFNDGRWHHMALTWEALSGAVVLYKDASPVFFGTALKGGSIKSGGSLTVGVEQDSKPGEKKDKGDVDDLKLDPNQSLIGQVDDVRVWSVVRDAKQIRANAVTLNSLDLANPAGSGLVLSWSFDDCSLCAVTSVPTGARGDRYPGAPCAPPPLPAPSFTIEGDIISTQCEENTKAKHWLSISPNGNDIVDADTECDNEAIFDDDAQGPPNLDLEGPRANYATLDYELSGVVGNATCTVNVTYKDANTGALVTLPNKQYRFVIYPACGVDDGFEGRGVEKNERLDKDGKRNDNLKRDTDEHKGHCYWIPTFKDHPDRQDDHCRRWGGRLASFDHESEVDHVVKHCHRQTDIVSNLTTLDTGLRKRTGQDGKTEDYWVDGSESSHRDYAPGYPKNPVGSSTPTAATHCSLHVRWCGNQAVCGTEKEFNEKHKGKHLDHKPGADYRNNFVCKKKHCKRKEKNKDPEPHPKPVDQHFFMCGSVALGGGAGNRCENAKFKYPWKKHEKRKDTDVQVLASINYATAPRSSPYDNPASKSNDANVVWFEGIKKNTIKVCAREDTPTEDGKGHNNRVADYMAFTPDTLPSSVGYGELAIKQLAPTQAPVNPPAWVAWVDTRCERFTFATPLASGAVPVVIASASHRLRGGKHNGFSHWVRDLSNTGMSICFKEVQNYDQLHDRNSWMNYITVDTSNLPPVVLAGKVSGLAISTAGGVTCTAQINFAKTFKTTPFILVEAVHTAASGAAAPSGGLTVWVEEMTNSYFRACAKGMGPAGLAPAFEIHYVASTCEDIPTPDPVPPKPDPCKDRTSGCSAVATCTRIDDKPYYRCDCPAPYTKDKDGQTCVPPDPCKDKTANCDARASCSPFSTAPFYRCVCPDRFTTTTDGAICVPPNPCKDKTHDCDALATCAAVEVAPYFTCTCPAGLISVNGGRQCVKPSPTPGPNPCRDAVPAPCDTKYGKCTQLQAAPWYQCSCPDAWKLEANGQCTPPKPCADGSAGCDPLATCANRDYKPYFDCTCPERYTTTNSGKTCVAPDPCKDGSHQCSKDAKCTTTATNPWHTCTCPTGWTSVDSGRACLPPRPCRDNTDNCDIRADCEDTDAAPFFKCTCPSGYTTKDGGKTCDDVDECKSSNLNDCDPKARCVNTVGKYYCECPPGGYKGKGSKADPCVDPDPCADGSAPCSKDAKCNKLAASPFYECVCPAGFRLSSDKRSCDDIDECKEGTHGCDGAAVAQCTNTPGSYQCECLDGYKGDGKKGSCKDVDECQDKTHNCHDSAGVCTNLLAPAKFSCKCKKGFVGDGVKCDDDDECADPAKNDCAKPGADCFNRLGGFECQCKAGYRGDGKTCTPIDECAEGTHDCHRNNGVCTDTVGGWTCACKPGYVGDGKVCDDDNECPSIFDSVGRHNCDLTTQDCLNTPGSFVCKCKDGYTLVSGKCVDINECLVAGVGGHNCHKYATCTNRVPGFDCACNAGYRGDGRDKCTPIDDCQEGSHNCPKASQCLPTGPGTFKCECFDGYSGPACDPVDECTLKTHKCSTNAVCDDLTPGYRCTCKEGFKGDGFSCADVNECDEGTHSCDAFADCTNTVGSFRCACRSGYCGDGRKCRDINECGETSVCTDALAAVPPLAAGLTLPDTLSKCSALATCTNRAGLFDCACNAGYRGDGKTCVPVDECTEGTHDCHRQATCSDLTPLWGCQCKAGFRGTGKICDDIDECEEASHTCHRVAKCSNTVGSYGCTCPPGYRGDGFDCKDIDECVEGLHDCESVNQCVNTAGSYRCLCGKSKLPATGAGSSCSDRDTCEYTGCLLKGALEIAQTVVGSGFTPQTCRKECAKGAFRYAALTNGGACECAGDLAPGAVMADDAMCSTPCSAPGASKERCGGPAASLYYSVYDASGAMSDFSFQMTFAGVNKEGCTCSGLYPAVETNRYSLDIVDSVRTVVYVWEAGNPMRYRVSHAKVLSTYSVVAYVSLDRTLSGAPAALVTYERPDDPNADDPAYLPAGVWVANGRIMLSSGKFVANDTSVQLAGRHNDADWAYKVPAAQLNGTQSVLPDLAVLAIRAPDGSRVGLVDLTDRDTVDTVVSRFSALTGVPADLVALVYLGRPLNATRTLRDQGITPQTKRGSGGVPVVNFALRQESGSDAFSFGGITYGASAEGTFTERRYHQVAVTRTASGIVHVALDGKLELSFNDTVGPSFLSNRGIFQLFGESVERGRSSGGAIARLRVYDYALQIHQLQRCDSVVPLGPDVDPPKPWPAGEYCLPMAQGTCPGVRWQRGSKYFDTADSGGQNAWSGAIPSGLYDVDDITMNICCHGNDTIGEGEWPAGDYCVYRKGGSCPTGFAEGFRLWDESDSTPQGYALGDICDGEFGQDARIEFCCRTDGKVGQEPIELPFGVPFFLFRKTRADATLNGTTDFSNASRADAGLVGPVANGTCQAVSKCVDTPGTVYWDDGGGNSLTGGRLPDGIYVETSTQQEFCLYEQARPASFRALNASLGPYYVNTPTVTIADFFNVTTNQNVKWVISCENPAVFDIGGQPAVYATSPRPVTAALVFTVSQSVAGSSICSVRLLYGVGFTSTTPTHFVTITVLPAPIVITPGEPLPKIWAGDPRYCTRDGWLDISNTQQIEYTLEVDYTDDQAVVATATVITASSSTGSLCFTPHASNYGWVDVRFRARYLKTLVTVWVYFRIYVLQALPAPPTLTLLATAGYARDICSAAVTYDTVVRIATAQDVKVLVSTPNPELLVGGSLAAALPAAEPPLRPALAGASFAASCAFSGVTTLEFSLEYYQTRSGRPARTDVVTVTLVVFPPAPTFVLRTPVPSAPARTGLVTHSQFAVITTQVDIIDVKLECSAAFWDLGAPTLAIKGGARATACDLLYTPPSTPGTTTCSIWMTYLKGGAVVEAPVPRSTFTVTVLDAPPVFSLARVVPEAEAGGDFVTYAKYVAVQPTTYVYAVRVSVSDRSVFSPDGFPQVATETGDLRFKPAAGTWGTVTITVYLIYGTTSVNLVRSTESQFGQVVILPNPPVLVPTRTLPPAPFSFAPATVVVQAFDLVTPQDVWDYDVKIFTNLYLLENNTVSVFASDLRGTGGLTAFYRSAAILPGTVRGAVAPVYGARKDRIGAYVAFTVTINDAATPGFTLGPTPNATVAGSATVYYVQWLTVDTETLDYRVNIACEDSATLFASAPALTTPQRAFTRYHTLGFQPHAFNSGQSKCTVTLNYGTGGTLDKVTRSQYFYITVLPRDPPTITLLQTKAVEVASGGASVTVNDAVAVDAKGQTVSLVVVGRPTVPILLSGGTVTVSSLTSVLVRSAADSSLFGLTEVSLALSYNGGTKTTDAVRLLISVTPPAPTFTLPACPPATANNLGAVVIPAFMLVTTLQEYRARAVVTSGAELFSRDGSPPACDNNGDSLSSSLTLRYAPSPYFSGTAVVDFYLTFGGGLQETAVRTCSITVNPAPPSVSNIPVPSRQAGSGAFALAEFLKIVSAVTPTQVVIDVSAAELGIFKTGEGPTTQWTDASRTSAVLLFTPHASNSGSAVVRYRVGYMNNGVEVFTPAVSVRVTVTALPPTCSLPAAISAAVADGLIKVLPGALALQTTTAILNINATFTSPTLYKVAPSFSWSGSSPSTANITFAGNADGRPGLSSVTVSVYYAGGVVESCASFDLEFTTPPVPPPPPAPPVPAPSSTPTPTSTPTSTPSTSASSTPTATPSPEPEKKTPPPKVVCTDPAAPFQCPRGDCVANATQCDQKGLCGSTMITCSDGTCARTPAECPAARACPPEKPYICYDGSCAVNVKGCPPMPACGTFNRRCPDWSCVSDKSSSCDAFRQCSTCNDGRPFKGCSPALPVQCGDETVCVDSWDKCPQESTGGKPMDFCVTITNTTARVSIPSAKDPSKEMGFLALQPGKTVTVGTTASICIKAIADSVIDGAKVPTGWTSPRDGLLSAAIQFGYSTNIDRFAILYNASITSSSSTSITAACLSSLSVQNEWGCASTDTTVDAATKTASATPVPGFPLSFTRDISGSNIITIDTVTTRSQTAKSKVRIPWWVWLILGLLLLLCLLLLLAFYKYRQAKAAALAAKAAPVDFDNPFSEFPFLADLKSNYSERGAVEAPTLAKKKNILPVVSATGATGGKRRPRVGGADAAAAAAAASAPDQAPDLPDSDDDDSDLGDGDGDVGGAGGGDVGASSGNQTSLEAGGGKGARAGKGAAGPGGKNPGARSEVKVPTLNKKKNLPTFESTLR